MRCEVEIRIANELCEIARLAGELKAFGEAHGIPREIVFDLTLACDELLTNTISYGYDDNQPHEIVIGVVVDGRLLMGEIRDDGKAFDPLTIPDPDLTLDIEERPIGGLGIYFARQVMDELHYRREDGLNIVTLKKSILPEEPFPSVAEE